MLRSTARRLSSRLKSRGRGRPTGRLGELGEAHHETRTRLQHLEEAHGRTAAGFSGLASAHHDTATTATEALEEARAARREADALGAHLPTLLNVLSSANGVARESRRAQEAATTHLADLAADVTSLSTHISNLARFVEEQGAALGSVGEQLQATQRATTEAFAEVDRRLAHDEARAEAIRREVMFEVRYGGGTSGLSGGIQTQVLRPERLSGDGPLRLNLGSGLLVLEDHVNVDARELEGVDVVADVRKLPFDPDTVDAVRSAHLLEHFPVEELRRVVLPHWRTILRPGGELRVIVPDASTMVQEFSAGRMPFEDLRLVTFGEQEYDGDFHFTMFTEASLAELLHDAGFEQVTVEDRGRRNGACYEMELVAHKPSHPPAQ